ncbi:hypothetical protein CFOL_v3_33419 [Cephalotus follicularis]|uniref:Glyoxal oxidase N-terminal domain-containing protein n=1 Tax=Cephalotus follicularis TaxID=3775 RepID=A0A1Q3DC32_CEPFO|nr:hypothetical protein CFOL_v3_33419 [Cephalotus follicularis]
MSVLFPVKLKPPTDKLSPMHKCSIVCGGSTHDALYLAETNRIYVNALDDCNRLSITDANPTRLTEKMPSPRIFAICQGIPSKVIWVQLKSR